MNLINAIDKLLGDCNSQERDFYKHKNLILTGENAIGKSKLIKELVKKSLKRENQTIYYIDPQNRVIAEDPDGGNTLALKKLETLELDKISEHRIKKGIFTKKDEFTPGNEGCAVAISALRDDLVGEKHYVDLFKKFWGIELVKEKTLTGVLQTEVIKVIDGGEIQELSSSESAKMRILLEVDFAINKLHASVVVIDEFDEFLSEETILDLATKLFSYYPETKFILVIHSLATIVMLDDVDVALICDEHTSSIDDNTVRFIDASNIKEIGQIEKVKNAMVCSAKEETVWEELVTHFVDFGKLTQEEKEYVCGIQRSSLLPKEKIFYDYLIQECR